MFTMCNAAIKACWDTATARRHWTKQWRHDQAGRHPLPYRTEFIIFFRKIFNQRRLQFLFTYSFSNWLAVSCVSFWKAFPKCPFLSGMTSCLRNDVEVLSKNVLMRWSIGMIRAKNYEIMSDFVKVMPRKQVASFFPDMVYIMHD